MLDSGDPGRFWLIFGREADRGWTGEFVSGSESVGKQESPV